MKLKNLISCFVTLTIATFSFALICSATNRTETVSFTIEDE